MLNGITHHVSTTPHTVLSFLAPAGLSAPPFLFAPINFLLPKLLPKPDLPKIKGLAMQANPLKINGGRSRNRTGVAGFAVPCITTLLPGRTWPQPRRFSEADIGPCPIAVKTGVQAGEGRSSAIVFGPRGKYITGSVHPGGRVRPNPPGPAGSSADLNRDMVSALRLRPRPA